jgi:effector-binding domain-containing protein
MAYEALTDWLKENKKKTAGLPYEMYVTDPVGKDGKLLDPYRVQTDIIFPHK